MKECCGKNIFEVLEFICDITGKLKQKMLRLFEKDVIVNRVPKGNIEGVRSQQLSLNLVLDTMKNLSTHFVMTDYVRAI